MSKCPKALSKTAKDYWRKLLPDVVAGGETGSRLQLLYLACDQLSQYELAKEAVDRDGLTIVNPSTGLLKLNPALVAQRQAFGQACQALKLLGVNVSEIVEDDGPDEIEAVIGGE